MSDCSVETRIREALSRAGGSVARARIQILDEAARDHDLLYGLTRPHLSGIVAYAVDRVVRKKAAPADSPPAEPAIQALPGEAFGKELLKALALGDPARFGEESFSASARRGGASQRHIDAIRLIAGESSPRKKP